MISSLRQSEDLHFRTPVRSGASVDRKAQLAAVVGSKPGQVVLSLIDLLVMVESVSNLSSVEENVEKSLERKNPSLLIGQKNNSSNDF